MKRSAQVALVLMGVTGTTATAAYMMPPPRDCGPQQSAPAATTTPATNLPPGVTPKQPIQGSCGRYGSHSYHSWSNWGWNSDRRYSSGGTPSSVSTALTNSGGRVSAVSSSGTSSSGSSASRGGFGSTGHSFSVSS